MARPKFVDATLRSVAKAAFAIADFPYRVRPGPRILIYHQVGAGLGRQMEVTREAFDFQLSWLRANGTIVSLDEALARRGESDSSRLFALTFDDGYRDIYEHVVPLLRRFDLPYTVYVTTEPVETGVAATPGGRADPLTWEQLKTMSDQGATIGAHTHRHPDLRRLGLDEVAVELATSDLLIESRLGLRPRHFCYPYGFWGRDADTVVRSRYETATLGAGPPITASTDPFLVSRVPVQLSDTRLFFVRKMKSGMVYEERARRRINGYQGVLQHG